MRCRHARNFDLKNYTCECRSNRIIHRDPKKVHFDVCIICPYKNKPNRWPMLGEALAHVLALAGVRKGPKCGCVARERSLNFLGLRIVGKCSALRNKLGLQWLAMQRMLSRASSLWR